MRIRSTRPEFWRSKTIAQLDWSTRLVLKGLESYVDDNGVGKDDLSLIAADVFPRDLSGNPIETLKQIAVAIRAIAEAGLIARYEVEGDALIYIDKWKDIQYIQHPKAGRFPRPDGTKEYKEPVSQASYRKPPANCRPVVGEQGSRGADKPPYPPADETAPNPPPQSRTKNGAELARTRFANIPTRSAAAEHIANLFSDSLPVSIETGVRTEIATQIDKCLRDAIPPKAMAEGLREWVNSASWHPSQIPKFVMKAAAKRTGVGAPTRKAAGYQEIADQIIAEMESQT